jgi:hypothetical protein
MLLGDRLDLLRCLDPVPAGAEPRHGLDALQGIRRKHLVLKPRATILRMTPIRSPIVVMDRPESIILDRIRFQEPFHPPK